MQMNRRLLTVGAAFASLIPHGAQAQQAPAKPRYSYADIADMALAAPIAAGAQIRSAKRLKGDLAPGLPAGQARFLVEANVQTLIRGAQGLPARVRYLVDLPLDAANRPPKLAKWRVLLLASTVPGKPGELRLVSPYAQLGWTPEQEARLRAILTEAVNPDAPPAVTGVGNAFHVTGSLPGESETQIFLTTSDRRPISLAVLRRPGEAPRWSVALGEMVDDSAAPPSAGTLLWYRLACFLPPALPDSSVDQMPAAEAEAARADYRLVLEGLGPCERTITQGSGQKEAISTPTPAQSG
jgi:hypothetical protein